jgi:ArsR family metal-binding transcriptional regulator
MRHERSCHVFKGFVGKCTVCGERFATSKLLWNTIKLWNDQCSVKSCQPYFENDVIFPLSKEQVDIVALRISYDMENFPRHLSFILYPQVAIL